MNPLSALLALSMLAGVCFVARRRLCMRLLFPAGYFLYAKTRLGYYIHQRRLKSRRSSACGPHSLVHPLHYEGMKICPVAFLEDNYCYLVVDLNTRFGVAIDPADPEAVKEALREHQVDLKAILTTHKHWDHAGGNMALKEEFSGLAVYGGLRDKPSGCTHLLEDNDILQIGALEFRAIWTPGHTAGHMVYVLSSCNPPCLFSGDHLFIGGCGKMFEGTPETMYSSLLLLKQMDPRTHVFPGHEYSWLNLQFAYSIEPENHHVKEKHERVRQLRLQRKTTVPSVLADELQFNPFLRTNHIELRRALKMDTTHTNGQVLSELRKWKDRYQRRDEDQ